MGLFGMFKKMENKKILDDIEDAKVEIENKVDYSPYESTQDIYKVLIKIKNLGWIMIYSVNYWKNEEGFFDTCSHGKKIEKCIEITPTQLLQVAQILKDDLDALRVLESYAFDANIPASSLYDFIDNREKELSKAEKHLVFNIETKNKRW